MKTQALEDSTVDHISIPVTCLQLCMLLSFHDMHNHSVTCINSAYGDKLSECISN